LLGQGRNKEDKKEREIEEGLERKERKEGREEKTYFIEYLKVKTARREFEGREKGEGKRENKEDVGTVDTSKKIRIIRVYTPPDSVIA
jgi:hypothetical protein